MDASLGAVFQPEGPLVSLPAWGGPVATQVYGGGVGFGVRGGIQMQEWLALDVQVFAESFFFMGNARASALLEISPVPPFAFSLGPTVGSMFVANLYEAKSADYAGGVLRLEGRPSERERREKGRAVVVVGVEVQAGAVFEGSVPPGTIVLGARAFGGLFVH